MAHDEDYDYKLARFSAMFQAWIDTRMEKDRTILALSTGGIGLLVTLITTVGPSSRTELVLFLLAALSFAVSVVAGVFIFSRNADHLQAVIKNPDAGRDRVLDRLDGVLLWFFLLGIVLTGLVALSAGRSHLESKNMSEKQGQERVRVEKSLSGISAVKPDQQRSLSGITEVTTNGGKTGGSGGASGQGNTGESGKK